MKAALDRAGINYEYQPKIFGKPDFIVPPKIIIFCDSSFWHGEIGENLDYSLKKDIGGNI